MDNLTAGFFIMLMFAWFFVPIIIVSFIRRIKSNKSGIVQTIFMVLICLFSSTYIPFGSKSEWFYIMFIIAFTIFPLVLFRMIKRLIYHKGVLVQLIYLGFVCVLLWLSVLFRITT